MTRKSRDSKVKVLSLDTTEMKKKMLIEAAQYHPLKVTALLHIVFSGAARFSLNKMMPFLPPKQLLNHEAMTYLHCFEMKDIHRNSITASRDVNLNFAQLFYVHIEMLNAYGLHKIQTREIQFG